MKGLKRISLRKALFAIIVMIILGAVCGAFAFPGLITRIFIKPVSWEAVDFDGEIDGLYVRGVLNGIYDYYCEHLTDGSVTQKEYIIDAGEEKYMGIVFSGYNIDKADALMQASQDYLNGKDNGSRLFEKQFEIEGTIRPISKETLKYYYDAVDYDNLSEQDKERFLPYYLKVGEVKGSYMSTMCIGVAASVAFLAAAIIYFIYILCGGCQKSIRKYITCSMNPAAAREKVEQFLESTQEIDGVKMSREYICGQNGSQTSFGELEKLAWAYKRISNGVVCALCLRFKDGSRQSVTMKNIKAGERVLERIKEQCPHVFLGYNKNVEEMFEKNREAFLKISYYPEIEKWKYNGINPDNEDFSK